MKILDSYNILSCWMYVKMWLNEMCLYLEIFFLPGMRLKYILKIHPSKQFICVACVWESREGNGLAWRTSIGSQRVGHNWSNLGHTCVRVLLIL